MPRLRLITASSWGWGLVAGVMAGVMADSMAGCMADVPGDEPRFTVGDYDSESPSMSTGTTGPTDVEDSTASSSSGEDVSAPEDPQYPRPEPFGPAGECPEGFFGPITFDLTGWVCIPECEAGDPPLCPSGQSGSAQGRCATNPDSSAEPCSDDTDCQVAGERCGNVGMEQAGCLLEPSHCILRCDDGQDCPDSMTCSPTVGLCQYVL
ncbi:MAG: hypothetical protein AAGF11_34370 [Myxococcota bacterium]